MELEHFQIPSTNDTLKQILSTYRSVLFKYLHKSSELCWKAKHTWRNIKPCFYMLCLTLICTNFFVFLLPRYSTRSTTSFHLKQERQCMYHVTLRHIHITIISMEKQLLLNIVCVCILALVTQHTNCIFSAPYYIVIHGLSGSTIFPPLYHKWHNFQKKIYWT